MTVVVVLNGDPPAPHRLRHLAARFPVVAADGGAAACREAGVRPQWVAGDLDSLRAGCRGGEEGEEGRDPFEGWEIREHPEQDRTDFQKVLAELPAGTDDLIIAGGLGRRTDHQLTNLLIAAGLPDAWRVVFEDGEGEMVRVTPACPYAAAPAEGSTLSLLPLPAARGVVTAGLRWNLHGADMCVGGQLGQSNQVTGPVRVEVGGGSLFVWTARRASPRSDPFGAGEGLTHG